jgi:hypothetical protein
MINFFKKKSGSKKKEEAVVGRLVEVTSGGSHGWYESNVGLIRKPIKKY